MSRVVLITGVSRYLGGRLASMLQADSSIDRVIGVDVVPPRQDVGRTESHGCFRLANWNAEYLLKLVNIGTRVLVEN